MRLIQPDAVLEAVRELLAEFGASGARDDRVGATG